MTTPDEVRSVPQVRASGSDTEELWFYLPDVRSLLANLLTGRQLPGQAPALHLYAQGELRYLCDNAEDPPLVDPGDDSSRQVVYAIGRACHDNGRSYPAGPGHGASRLTGVIYWTPQLAEAAAGLRGHDWFVVTGRGDGLRWQTSTMPRPQPTVQWRPARIALSGLPGLYPAQVATGPFPHGMWYGKLRAADARRAADALAASRWADQSPFTIDDLDNAARDSDGWISFTGHRPWIIPDLAPAGQMLPYTATDAGSADAPACRQFAYFTAEAVHWIGPDGLLVSRSTCGAQLDPTATPIRPTLVAPFGAELHSFHAVEHMLRTVEAVIERGPLASQFTSLDVEALITTAAELVNGEEHDSLSQRQMELARRAVTLLDC